MTDAADALRFAAPYRVRFDEAGADGLLRTSGLLRYAQDVAWRHSESLGFDRAWYAARGVAWLVRAAELEVAAPIPMGVTLDVSTRVLGYSRIWARRRAEARLPDGELAAWIHTDWVLVDGRGRLSRVPAEITSRFTAPMLTEPLLRVPLPSTPSQATRRTVAVRPHELDPMDHPNNAVYVDWLEDVVGAAAGGATAVAGLPRRLRLEYAAAPGPGDTVEAAAWPAAEGWAHRLTAADGSDLLRATLF